ASGILPGVTRVVVFELAAKLGIKVKEVNIKPEELFTADEAFLTNSMIEVMPLTFVSSKPVGAGKPGKMARRLVKAYREMVKEETST
ncbi:MAG: aminotransferase class IV, partial [bacterium]|nr:aminotransferase class IV [bacterium]